jgi:hypothetical protein
MFFGKNVKESLSSLYIIMCEHVALLGAVQVIDDLEPLQRQELINLLDCL